MLKRVSEYSACSEASLTCSQSCMPSLAKKDDSGVPEVAYAVVRDVTNEEVMDEENEGLGDVWVRVSEM